MKSCENIQVRFAGSGPHLREGLEFLEKRYRAAFNVHPSAPTHLLTAYQEGVVVGTIGINTATDISELRLARIFEFDHACAPFPVVPERSVEICRWSCNVPAASAQLIYAAVRLSRELGKEYVWCEHDAIVHRAARRFGIYFHAVPGAHVREEYIEPEYRAYYQRTTIDLYMFSIPQAIRALSKYLQNDVAS